jgi:hypothetical protein
VVPKTSAVPMMIMTANNRAERVLATLVDILVPPGQVSLW